MQINVENEKLKILRLNDVKSMFVDRRSRLVNRECAIRRRMECSEKLKLGWQFRIEQKREFELVRTGLNSIVEIMRIIKSC